MRKFTIPVKQAYVTVKEVEDADPCFTGYRRACEVLRIRPLRQGQYDLIDTQDMRGWRTVNPDDHIPLSLIMKKLNGDQLEWMFRKIPRLQKIGKAWDKVIRAEERALILKRTKLILASDKITTQLDTLYDFRKYPIGLFKNFVRLPRERKK